MPNLFRPTPRHNGQRRHALHRALVDGGVRYVVLDSRGDIRSEASVPISRMSEGGLALTTVPRYARGFLTYLDDIAHVATSTAPGTYDPWSPPPDVVELFKDCLRRLGGTLEESTEEAGVFHVTVEDEENHDRVVAAICGVFHFYDAAVKAGLYSWPNPFELPFEQRRSRMIPGLGQTGLTVTPRFRFRIPQGEAPALRSDASDRVLDIVPALIAARAPLPVIMMIKLMIEGLARIAEQARISIWDWWKSSEFGKTIDTTNKGGRGRRTKQQCISDELLAELTIFGNDGRVAFDANGWSLDDWRRFLSDPTKSQKERRLAAKRAPLFPARHGGFYSRSGIVDTWYRPAMRAAGLPTRTHYLRHSGVNDFLAYVDARDDLTPDEKAAAKLEFGKRMGWRWPLAMLERYSLPARKTAQIVAADQWLASRRTQQDAIAAGLGRPAQVVPIRGASTDRQLSRLVRHSTIERKAA